jgi:hypothetical protein
MGKRAVVNDYIREEAPNRHNVSGIRLTDLDYQKEAHTFF